MTIEYKLSFPAADINRRLEKVDSLIQTINNQAPDDNGNFDGLATADYVDTSIINILLAIYPVGAIYLSVDNTSPASLFGGTWGRIEDTFLLGAGATYIAGSTGGEATHTLTIAEMPNHTHTFQTTAWVNRTGNIQDCSTLEYIDYEINRQTKATGGSQPHNNMPPYLAVYIWQRIE